MQIRIVEYARAHLSLIGRFKTSHLWALFKTSHDVMHFVSSDTTLQ